MAMDGLLALVCASAVITAGPSTPVSGAAGENRDSAVATTLAVQTAMQQGKQHLVNGEYRAAVSALESQLAYINGNQVYLKLLQDAYRGYVKELRLAKQDDEAQRYLRRLLILDRGAILDMPSSVGNAVSPSPPAAKVSKPAETPAAKNMPLVRLKGEDDPFQSSQALDKPDNKARALLAQAEQKFGDRRFQEALLLYEQAHRADQGVTDSCRDRWAYCKLFYVVEQLNQADRTKPSWTELEHEVRVALELAPRLEYGKSLLAEIQKRRVGRISNPSGRIGNPSYDATAEQEAGVPEAPVSVRHSPKSAEGYFLAETAHFRIFHTQAPELAEKTAQVAERTRTKMQQKWFGGADDSWSPKCDLYLHATAQDYGRVTGIYNSPGHSTIKMENGRIVLRRIDLRCDDATMLSAVLPHEATHIVLAGQFGQQLAPRWADEGMAVLTEPAAKIERHLSNLPKCYQDCQLFRLQALFQMEKYPENPRDITTFYAQSVSLVDFLSSLRGSQEFTFFLHDGMRYGYEKSLQRHYGYQNLVELEQRWLHYALSERAAPAGVAQRSP